MNVVNENIEEEIEQEKKEELEKINMSKTQLWFWSSVSQSIIIFINEFIIKRLIANTII